MSSQKQALKAVRAHTASGAGQRLPGDGEVQVSSSRISTAGTKLCFR
ncbi:hypothetical protein ACH4JS_15985 [Streptomyces sp. NPDC017638]